MNLIKTSFFTSIGVTIQITALFIINKIVAIYVGPSGLAIIGQFQNFAQITQAFANGAINQGVIKYVAEYSEDDKRTKKTLSAALAISISCSFIIAILLFLFRHILALRLLGGDGFAIIFTVFAFTVVLFALNNFLLSVLNGKREIKKYVLSTISSSLVGLIITCFLTIYYHLLGALIALVTFQSVVFVITLSFVMRCNWFRWRNFFNKIDKKYVIKLFKYSIMAIVTATTLPIGQIIIRNYIGANLSWDDAGYWQGITKISDVYLLLVTSVLGVYYLPRLAELTDKRQLKKEIFAGYKIILPVVSILALGVYLLRKEVVYVLFSDKFLPMLTLFKFQLLGDVIKIGSWLLSYIMVAKAMVKTFITTEIVFNALYVLLAVIGFQFFGLQGVVMGFAFNYVLYWITLTFIYKSYLKK